MSRLVKLALWIYRRLADAYPHEFRMVYGADLDRMGEDAVPEAWRRYGVRGLARLIADIALRLPVEYAAEMRQDVAYAVRMHAKSPGFAAVSILSLAIGIGICTVVLGESKGLVGPAPGVRDPASLVTIEPSSSYPYFERYRNQRRIASSATAVLGPVPFAVARPDAPNARAERVYGRIVSPEFFSTLGIAPQAGRFFRPETEKSGMAPVVVISDGFWRTHLGANPDAVGSALRLNGQVATVIGIAPQGFLGLWPWKATDLYVPVTCGSLAPELAKGALEQRDAELFRVVLRLRPGVSVAAAESALTAAMRALDGETPGLDAERKERKLRLIPAGTMTLISPEQRRFVVTYNVMLWALVLSLSCANLANLLLARGTARRREIAVRLSVGASRWRLVRQLLTESVLLGLVGGVASLLPAYWFTHMVASLQVPAETPIRLEIEPDFVVLAFSMAIALAAGVGFGLAPALTSARVDIGRALKEGAQAPLPGYRRFGLRNLFVGYQVASSLMLLLVAGCIIQGYRLTTRLDAGINTNDLGFLALDPTRDGYSAEQSAELFRKLPDELARVDGVQAVALTGTVPLVDIEGHWPNTRVSAEPVAPQAVEVQGGVFRTRIGAYYFKTLEVALVRGREFDERDQRAGTRPGMTTPAILNQTAARALFGNADPIGRRLREGAESYTVVGVSRDVRTGFLITTAVPTLFLPFTAESFEAIRGQSVTMLVRGTAGRETLAAVRKALAARYPDLTVFKVRTARQDLETLNSFVEWSSSIYVTLGVFALLLAGVGLGGVTAYAVAQRRKEIGIRMALGARGGQVRRLVLREGVALVSAGLLMGFAGASALGRVSAATMSAMAPTFAEAAKDPMLIAGAPLLLACLALAACYWPARRATEIDPVRALREE